MEILQNIVLGLLIIASIVVIVAILMLPPRESSMGGAIGGSAEDLNIFGKKRSHGAVAFLERVTIISSVIFMLSAFVYNVLI